MKLGGEVAVAHRERIGSGAGRVVEPAPGRPVAGEVARDGEGSGDAAEDPVVDVVLHAGHLELRGGSAQRRERVVTDVEHASGDALLTRDGEVPGERQLAASDACVSPGRRRSR